MKEQLISIGFTKKAHGSAGEVKVTVKEGYLEDFLEAEVAFINVQGKPLPFFIENFRDVGDLLVKFEDIDSPNDATQITSKEIFLREQDLTHFETKAEETLHFSALKGYTLWDAEIGEIGKILEILEFPQQEMAQIQMGEKEILIPLHEDLIVHLDRSQKK